MYQKMIYEWCVSSYSTHSCVKIWQTDVDQNLKFMSSEFYYIYLVNFSINIWNLN